MLVNLLRRLRQRIGLRAGTDYEGTMARITTGASLSAENLWLLGCSAVIASIGLDVGSAAVIIGAMLISPLMGPILGVGLALGTLDRGLLWSSLRELGFATAFVILASAGYFVLSPLASPTAEMIARTRPTLLDIGVAFFGGIAGVVAGSRKVPSLALPGVAIATALMPPLCTAGFGLATWNIAFLAGAFYLFGLNAIFIGLATFLIVRFLRFPRHEVLSDEARRRELRVVAVVVVLASLPSVYFLYDAAVRLQEQGRIGRFVEREIDGPGRSVAQWQHDHHGGADVLRVFVAGHPIAPARADSIRASLPRYGLPDIQLEIIQSDISASDLERFQGQVQRDLLQTISATLASRDSAAQDRARRDSTRVATIAREIREGFPEIAAMTFAPALDLLASTGEAAGPAILVTFHPGIRPAIRADLLGRVRPLFRQRLGLDSLTVVER